MGRFRRSSLLAVSLAGALLAACSSAPGEQNASAPTAAEPTIAVAAASPTLAASATTAPTTLPPPTAAPATPQPTAESPPTPPPAAVAPSVAAAADGPYAGIPQLRTAEGYQVLGSPDAQISLVMYSDFL